MKTKVSVDSDDGLEQELQRLIAQATQETVNEHSRRSGAAKFPWTATTAAEFRQLLETPDGIEELICDPYFLGLGDFVYASVLKDIIELFDERKRRVINLVVYIEGIGCVSVNSLIPIPGFGLVRFGSLNPGTESRTSAPLQTTVINHLGQSVKTTRYFNSGFCLGRHIELRGGFSISVTRKHPLYVMTAEGPIWKAASELEEDDFVGIRIGTRCFGDKKISTTEAYLLGCCTGDGHNKVYPRVGGRSLVTVASSEAPWHRKLIDWFEEVGSTVELYTDKRCGHFRLKVDWDLLKEVPEICCLSYDKRVPNLILTGSEEEQVAFLQGLFDSDGGVSKLGHPTVSSVNRALMEDVQLLLANLGILSLLSLKKTKWQNGRGFTWRLKVEAHAEKFFEIVGFRLSRKQQKRSLVSQSHNHNIDVIPYVSSLMRRVNYGSPQFGTREGASAKYKYLLRDISFPCKAILREFLDKYSDTTDIEALEILSGLAIDEGLVWLPVVSNSNEVGEYADLEVPDGHSFVTSSIVNHNSGKCIKYDSLVPCSSGLRQIKELGPEIPINTSAPVSETIATDTGSAVADTFFNSGTLDGIELVTHAGYSVCGTYDHPVMTKERGWVKLGNLTIGEKVAVVPGTSMFGTDETLSVDEAYLAGFLLGDGHLNYLPRSRNSSEKKTWNTIDKHPRFGFTVWKNDPSFFSELRKLCDVLGLEWKDLEDPRRGNFRAEIAWPKAWELPELLSKTDKRIPACILQSSAVTQRSFIAGLFDADSGVSRQGAISISQKTRETVATLQLILLNLGIFSVLRRKKTKWQNGTGVAWRLKIGPHANRFADQIPLKMLRKAEKIRKTPYNDRLEIDNNIVWCKVETLQRKTNIEFFDLHVPEHHCFVGNGILCHNTLKFSILQFLQWFDLCTVSHDPQAHFNLVPGSTIALINLSRTEQQARRVCFSEVWKRFQCPFVQDYFTPNPRYTKEINIPQNNTLIFAGTSSAMSALGYNLYGGGVDEASFLEIVEESKKAGNTQVYDAAEQMHNAIFDRMTSRFMRDGIIPGMLIMFSSPRYPDDFLERKCRQAEELGDESGIFWRRRSTWSAKGKKFFPSGNFFYIDTDTQEIVDEEDALDSGKLLFLSNDSMPPHVESGLTSGTLVAKHTNQGLNVLRATPNLDDKTPARSLLKKMRA